MRTALEQRPVAARRALLAERGLEFVVAHYLLDPVATPGALWHLGGHRERVNVESGRVELEGCRLLGRDAAGEEHRAAGEEPTSSRS